MSPQGYTEERLVEQPAMELLAELGWETVSALDEALGSSGVLGRDTKSAVVLAPRLRPVLERLNPTLPADAINSAINELTRDRSTMSLAAANREVWELVRDGVKVLVPDRERGGQKTERVRVIDWDNPQANDLLLVSQMTITGDLYTCRPDLIGFVNGLPFVVIELKKPGVPARQAFDENLTSYKHLQNGIPALFWYNVLLIASNGSDSRVGTLTADWERFTEWKRIEREDEPRRVSLEVMIRGLCEPTRLLDFVENFTLFSEHKSGLVKAIAQNHQYLGVNNAIRATLGARAAGHGRGGVFWQTQGSGKSFAMVFFCQKILRKVPGNWTFVIVTDRVDLDDQIAKTFAACGAVSDANTCHAETGTELRELLAGNNRYVFTLIQKFQTPEILCDRRDVIVLTDEAHRTQYDTLALNMRSALPNALFLAFTGTPLIAGEERTREVFGDYVSIYDFQQSVEDGATVPLFYENRTPELHLDNPNLNDDIYALIEDAELSEEGEKKLEHELGRQYHLITRDERLETIAKDLVQHFLGRGFQGKAMVVSIDKPTAYRMYHKVQKHWKAERERVEKELRRLDLTAEQRVELEDRLTVIRTTDTAVVVSPGQNEIEQMKPFGIDVVPHRKRMNDEALDEKFKDPADPLRLVFVCAMWLTGFDAPSCSTIYLDKPMRNHSLMQTIARANRVYPGKQSGLIVDYANVFASLEKALAIYGKGRGGETPVRDKKELAEELRKAVRDATAFCRSHGVNLVKIEETPTTNFARVGAIKDAANLLMAPENVRRDFLSKTGLVIALYRAVKPDPVAIQFAGRCACLAAIADEIRTTVDPPNIAHVLQGIQELLDESIAAVPFTIGENKGGYFDLSKIDFEALRRKFDKKKPTNTDLERLKAAVKAQLERMVLLNRTRADYLAKFQELIEGYNAGSRNIEEIFKELLALSSILTEEQTRHVRENLSEEELTVFDILTRPGPDLMPQEREEVKKVAKQLLTRLKDLLVLGWRLKIGARAQVRLAIEDALDDGLPRAYSKELYQTKCTAIFEHVYESYQGEGRSVYTTTI
ncbi:MAG: type I restriction endonuclease subunit R [Candidatus Binatia bacterium]